MNKDMLEDKKVQIEAAFKDLALKKSEIEEEMARLQGEHRLVIELLEQEDSIELPKRLRKVKEDAPN